MSDARTQLAEAEALRVLATLEDHSPEALRTRPRTGRIPQPAGRDKMAERDASASGEWTIGPRGG